jgi:hypothetical protein
MVRLLLVVLGLLVAAEVSLHTSAGEALLRARIEQRLTQRFTTKVKLERVGFSLQHDIDLYGLTIDGNTGTQAITVGHIHVEPRYGEILRGTPVLAALSVDQLNVQIDGKADGTTNLTGIYQSKPVEHIVIESLKLERVSVAMSKPDGTHVKAENLSLHGSIDARPIAKDVRSSLELDVSRFELRKPGVLLTAKDFRTSVLTDLVATKGPLTVGPTRAEASLTREDRAAVPMTLGLPAVAVNLQEGELALSMQAAQLFALMLAGAKVEVRRQGETLQGQQAFQLDGVSVRADAVNKLAGKDLLRGDIAFGARASGPAEALRVDVDLTPPSGGGTIEAHGIVNAQSRTYDLTLTARDLNAEKVLYEAPEASLQHVQLHVAGKGTDKESVDLRFELDANEATIRGKHIERMHVEGTFKAGALAIEKFNVGAMGQNLAANVAYNTQSKDLKAEFRLQGSVQDTLSALRKSGTAVPTSPLLATLSIAASLAVNVEGRVGERLRVTVREGSLGALGGAVEPRGTVDLRFGDESKGEKRVSAEDVDVRLNVRNLSLKSLDKARGKDVFAGGFLSGAVDLHGPPSALHVKADLALKRDDGENLLRAQADVVLSGKALLPGAPLRLVVLPIKRSLRDFAPLLVASEKVPEGEVDLAVDIHGSGARPEGEVRIAVRGPLVPSIAPNAVNVAMVAKIGAAKGLVHVDLSTEASAGETRVRLVANADAAVPLSKDSLRNWSATLELPDTAIASLPLSPSQRGDLAGNVGAKIEASGDRWRLRTLGKVSLKDVTKSGKGHVNGEIAFTVEPERTTVTVKGAVGDRPILIGQGELALGGDGFFAQVKDARTRALHATLEVPRTPIGPVVPVLASATIGGHADVSGTLTAPTLNGSFKLSDYVTLDGASATSELDIDATLDALKAAITFSKAADCATAACAPLALEVSASPRAYLDAKKGEGTVAVDVRLHGENRELTQLLPKIPALTGMGLRGMLAANLHALVALHVKGDTRTLESVTLEGPLELSEGGLQIPGSTRHFDPIALRMRGQGTRLLLETLELHEKDGQDRVVQLSGNVDVLSRQLSARAALTNVLLFGGNFGQADAPRAEATGSVQIAADLAATPRRIDVSVEALELNSPDRFLRAHQQEVLSLGDIVELGDRSVAIGKLAVPEAVPVSAPRADTPTLIVHVDVPRPIHVLQRPLNLFAKGHVRIERFGDERVLSGGLTCEKGDLLVGGLVHPLHHGEIKMTPEGAFLDLHFVRVPHVAALRDYASAGGTELYAHMVGSYGKQKISFSGVADGLFDALAVNNGGRVRVLSAPDLPGSQTAQLPQIREIRQTAFMGANLPHLAFLTRMSTLADPNVNRFAYGRFERLEADRFSEDGKRRFRVTARSPAIGQSDGEVEYDYLWNNSARGVSGVGVVGGTRGGGGPVLFWEWNSAD